LAGSPTLTALHTGLADAGVEVVGEVVVTDEPSVPAVEGALERLAGADADVVLAIGGGSAIDTAKAIAGLLRSGTRLMDHLEGVGRGIPYPGPAAPLVAVPTTAGTGSEMTHYAVFNNPRLREKSTIVSERIIPRAALVDPELTYSCPPRLTALTGVDVLAHALEAYINVASTPFARLVSIEAVRLVGAWLPRAVENGCDAEARHQMAWASALGGVAIAHANPTLPHALGQAAGGFVHAPHGASVAACLVEVMRSSHSSAPQSFADIAAALEPGCMALPLAERAARSVVLIDELLGRIGARVRFGELGLKESDLERVTGIALTAYATGIGLHPWKAGEREILRIYRSCL
jgi:alcohol dehydrogenase class IV